MRKKTSTVIFSILMVIASAYSLACNVLPDTNKSMTLDTGKGNDQPQGGTLMSGSLGTKYERVSVSTAQVKGEGADGPPSINADGRYVAFGSYSMHVVGKSGGVLVRDLQRKVTELSSTISYGADIVFGSNPSISSNGRFVAFESDYPFGCGWSVLASPHAIWVSDRTNNSTDCAVVFLPNSTSHSYNPSISADGRYVAFMSYASLTQIGSLNGSDIYLRDLQNDATFYVSHSIPWGPSDRASDLPCISGNGKYIVYESMASNIVSGFQPGDFINKVLVYDMATGTNSLISPKPHSFPSYEPSISSDGRYIAFITANPNLPSKDPGYGKMRLFIHDQQTKSATIVNPNFSVSEYKGRSIDGTDSIHYPSISGNGRYVAFIIYKERTGTHDLAVHDLKNNATTLIVRDEPGDMPNRKDKPSISYDGRYIAFLSGKTDLAPGDTNGQDDVFVYFNNVLSEVPLVPSVPQQENSKPHMLETPLQHK